MGVECDDFYFFDDPRPSSNYPGGFEVRKYDWPRGGYTLLFAGTADECDDFFEELSPEDKRTSFVEDAIPRAQDFEYER